VRAATIRTAHAADAAVLAALHGACFADEPWRAEAVAEVLAMPGAFACLAVPAGASTPSGFLIALDLGAECELLALGVTAPARRRGLARALMDRLLAIAGVRPIRLEVAEGNLAALTLYEGMGFVTVGRRPGYYQRPGGGASAALTMSRPALAGA
jgi:ribosomal-protein-alanine N-acetyltransferase